MTLHAHKNQVVSRGNYHSDKFSVDLKDYRSGLKQGWHKHEDFVIVMNLRGFLREQVNCRDKLVKPLSIGIKAPDLKHTDHFQEKE